MTRPTKRAAKKAAKPTRAPRKATARKATRGTTPAKRSSRKSAPPKVTPARKRTGSSPRGKAASKTTRATTKRTTTARKAAAQVIYKLFRPLGKGKYASRRMEEKQVVFTLGKAMRLPDVPKVDPAKLLCTAAVFHAYRNIGQALKYHGDHVGLGLWALVECETEGIVADDGAKVGVVHIKPIKELGQFDSARLSQRKRYETIKKAKTAEQFVKATKVRR